MTQLRMKYFGWGREGESLTAAEEAFVLERIQQGLTALLTATSNRRGLRTSSLNHPVMLNPPASLPFCSTGLYDRASHTTANHSLIMSADSSAILATRQISLLIHALRKRSRWCLTGQAALRPV